MTHTFVIIPKTLVNVVDVEGCRQFDTIEHAEKVARKQCRIFQETVLIQQIIPGQPKLKNVATVSLDAYDRVWTDVAPNATSLL